MSDEVQHTRMTIGQHLEELRWRLLKAICYVFVALMVCLSVQEHLMKWALGPHNRVISNLEQEVRYREAPTDLRGDVHAAKESDSFLAARLAKVERRELQLRESVQPAGPRLKELVAAQEAVKKRLETLEEQLAELGDSPTAAQLAPITSERIAIAKDTAALHHRYTQTALPYVDTLARVPDARLMDYKYQGPFLSYLKLSFICALFLASPWVAREMWGFVAVGLYPHEKRHINLFAPLSLFCFGLGGLFGYFVLIPVGLYFLSTYAPPEMMAGTFALGEYLSLFMTLTVVVGLVFELPLIMSFLTLIGVMNAERYRKYRRYWWFAAVVIGALLTPPDPATQMLLAIPMVGLYEVGILISVFIKPTRRDPPEDDSPTSPGAGAAPPPKADPAIAPKPKPKTKPKPKPAEPSAQSLIRPVDQPRVARGEVPTADPGPEVPASTVATSEPEAGEQIGTFVGEEEYEGEGDNDDPTLKYLYEDSEPDLEPEPAAQQEDEAESVPQDAEPEDKEPIAEADPGEEIGTFEGEEEYEGEGDNDDPTLKYLYEEPEPAEEPAGTESEAAALASDLSQGDPEESSQPGAEADPDEEIGTFEGEEEYEGEGDNDDPTLRYLYEEPEPEAPESPPVEGAGASDAPSSGSKANQGDGAATPEAATPEAATPEAATPEEAPDVEAPDVESGPDEARP